MAVVLEFVSDLAFVDVQMARLVRHAVGSRYKADNVTYYVLMVELVTKITAPVKMDSLESSVSHPFVRSSVSMEVAVLDLTSAHVRMDLLETAVSKITGLVLVIPKLETGCVITNYGVWSAQDSHAAQLLDKRGGTRVNVVLANQNPVIEDISQIFGARHAKTSMNVKLSQRSVQVEDVSTLLGATIVNVPREKNLTQTLRNALTWMNAPRFQASVPTADARTPTVVFDVFAKKDLF